MAGLFFLKNRNLLDKQALKSNKQISLTMASIKLKKKSQALLIPLQTNPLDLNALNKVFNDD